jgi:hypothetical protein
VSRPQVAEGDGLQIWSVAANILNKKSRTADKELSDALAAKKTSFYEMLPRSLNLEGFWASCCEQGNELTGSMKDGEFLA